MEDTEPAAVETTTGSTGAEASSADGSSGGPAPFHCGHRTDSHDWALPALDLPLRHSHQPLPRMSGGDICVGGGHFSFTTLDVDGDGFPDLVVYSACTDQTVGKLRWIIFPGGASGFGAPYDWALPQLELADAPSTYERDGLRLGDRRACSYGTDFTYNTFDMTGDGVVDLVEFDACDLAGVGDDHWRVHPGGPEGFAPPFVWPLPTIDLPGFSDGDLLDEQRDQGACSNGGTLRFSVEDVTGDGLPDLFFQGLCDLEETRWVVYPGDGSGFGEAIEWELPKVELSDGSSLRIKNDNGGEPCPNDQDFWFLWYDITGNGIKDLVVTDACDEGVVGEDHWLVYPGSLNGFGEPLQWELPSPHLPEGTDVHDAFGHPSYSCPNGERFGFYIADVELDGYPDLVQFSACGAASVGTTHHLVYPGRGSGFGSPFEARLRSHDNAPTQVADPDDLEPPGAWASCTNATWYRVSYTIDMNRDGLPDLVELAFCGKSGIGSERWRVFDGYCE